MVKAEFSSNGTYDARTDSVCLLKLFALQPNQATVNLPMEKILLRLFLRQIYSR
jgi:hypothetical protein